MATAVRSAHDGGQKRTSITILVLGDEGVGKSSLISTFVSRHFSEVVPGIMTRVRLPPDPGSSCITTIVDSQGGDGALISAVAALSLPGSDSAAGSRNSNSLTSLQRSLTSSTGTAASSGQVGGGGGIENVDSIILIYDLDRVETFYRLENHWLPLIERCYSGELPVIVAGNKMDLFRPSTTTGVTDEQVLARSRQQIVSLMQRFRFIRQCIKCSAKNLLRVDEIFSKAQQAVLYPFNPLYNLEIGRLSDDCQRAFTRIFRMYDQDHDGLLSDSELDKFQHETFHFPIYERDFTGWKKVVSRNNPTNEEVVRDGKFTVAGFLAIFDVFISQNRLDVPWQALRKFGYDDNLVLRIPDSISLPMRGGNDEKGAAVSQAHQESDDWSLSPSARRFLTDLFHQFDSDQDGILSQHDLETIFSIIPEASLPPWHPQRASVLFQGCFSLPKVAPIDSENSELQRSVSDEDEVITDGSTEKVVKPSTALAISTQSLSASGITIVSGESLPTVDLSSSNLNTISKPLSFLEWMGLWHTITAISASRSRAELFRLGHVEDLKRSKRRRFRSMSSGNPIKYGRSGIVPDALLPSYEVRVLVLGSSGCGKTALLNSVCRSTEQNTAFSAPRAKFPETSCAFLKLKRKRSSKKSSKKVGEDEEFVVHLIFTEVPEADDENYQKQRIKKLSDLLASSGANGDGGFDLVALAFDATDLSSFAYVKELEQSLLTEDTPRVYIGTKSDLLINEQEGGDIDTAPSPKGGDIDTPPSPNDGGDIDVASSPYEGGDFDVASSPHEGGDFDVASSPNQGGDFDVALSPKDGGEIDIASSPHEDGEIDTTSSPKEGGDVDIASSPEFTEATMHCRGLDLEPPFLTSARETNDDVGSDASVQERQKFLEHLARCCLAGDAGIERLRSKPHEEEKRREADRRRNRKLMWFGVGVGVAVAVVGYLWVAGASSKGGDGDHRKNRFGGWLSNFLYGSTDSSVSSGSKADAASSSA